DGSEGGHENGANARGNGIANGFVGVALRVFTEEIESLVDDEDGVVDDHSGEDDKAEDGEDVHVLDGHVTVHFAPFVNEEEAEETSHSGKGDGEDDDQWVAPGLEKNDHEEIDHEEGQEEAAGEKSGEGTVAEEG